MTDSYIPAATIVLMRDAPDFEVMMIERHADIVFAGGALVFPGGRIDAGDHDPAWLDHAEGLGAVPETERAPRIASIREAFEETGILLARRNGEMIGAEAAESLASWRKRVENDDRLFLEMIAAEGLSIAIDTLCLFARWRPPRNATHRRYDTWFFAAKAPERQRAHADGGEATEILWTTPTSAITDCREGRRKMIFPTMRNMELLQMSESTQAVIASTATRDTSPIEPRIVERDGERFLTIPNDRGYPVTEEPLELAMRG
mgnify:CR=1 FL=1